jgi:hypothetical protein
MAKIKRNLRFLEVPPKYLINTVAELERKILFFHCCGHGKLECTANCYVKSAAARST